MAGLELFEEGTRHSNDSAANRQRNYAATRGTRGGAIKPIRQGTQGTNKMSAPHKNKREMP